jgi:beta-lactamase regulating signal transducer with metallopeptidase domain
MLGCLLSLCRTFVTWRRIQQKIASSTQPAPPQLIDQIEQLATKLGIRKTIRVAITAEPIGPAVIGIWKPLMILPLNVVSTKSAQELEPILAHELLHVRRGDTWVAVLETLVRACWWFHPSVQRAAEATSQAGELCCDQDVLRELLYAPRRYAESLLDVCEATCQLQPLVGSPGIRAEQVTRDRLKRIMTSRGSRPRQLLNMGLLILGLLIVLPGSSINTASPIDHSGSTTADKSLNNSPSATSNLAATIRDRLLN